MSKSIRIDAEFEKLIPALATDEYEQLEASLLADGCRDALIVWAGEYILVDGHNRYAFCQKHQLPYHVIEREFDNRDAVILWMLDNQFARRNLTDAARIRLALHYKGVLARQAKERQGHGQTAPGKTLVANSPQALKTKGKTREKLANKAGMGYKKLLQGEKVVNDAPVAVQTKWDAGELSTNKAYELTKALEKIPVADRSQFAENTDDVEKVETLGRLFKSMGKPGTNGTYEEIVRTGGFQYGDEMEKWCDFWKVTNREITHALDSIADHHAHDAQQQKPHVSQASGESEWYTPQAVIDCVHQVLDVIDLDPASTEIANTIIQARQIYTAQEDGLAQTWRGRVYMNPPYAQPLIAQFCQKLADAFHNGEITEAIVLVNNATETNWFISLVNHAAAVCFPSSRIKFWNEHKIAAPLQGQAIVYMGPQVERFTEVFKTLGWCAHVC